MRVFVTGASGWIGSAVVPELIGAGHQVVGLARSDASAAAITAAGAAVHRGSLDDLESLRAGAADSDGVIHLAFVHDFANHTDSVAVDERAIEAMGSALEGSGRPFLIASGAPVNGRVATERDMPSIDQPRGKAAHMTVDLANRGVRSCVVRYATTVHGDGDHGFIAMRVAIARERGVAAYVGDGAMHWPAVHVLDAARVTRLALEQAPAGTAVHAIGEEGIPQRAIAEAIGRGAGVPAVSIEPDAAVEHFGWLGTIVALDIRASNAVTREELGWEPQHRGLLADLDEGTYFGDH